LAARTAISAARIDGAVLDVNLGRETSLGLARDLLADDTPVLFVTAHVDDDILFQQGLAGC
ncbi:MAG: DNA-binding response regulator, partial [Gaiellaceae bacterium]